jgi:hypothetical protein
MKKGIFILFAFILYVSSSYAQGFDPAKVRVGAGLAYATEISTAGLTLTGIYEIDETWEGAFAYNHFFEKDYVKWSVFDFDGHYIFHEANSALNVYGLAGLSITRWSIDMPSTTTDTPFGPMTVPGYTDSDSNFGLNLGVGANYSLTDLLNVAPELRYTITNGGYLRIGATVQYKF